MRFQLLVEIRSRAESGEGLSTYNVEEFAKCQGVSIDDWLEVFRKESAERGGTIVYEGDEEDRPDWLKDELCASSVKPPRAIESGAIVLHLNGILDEKVGYVPIAEPIKSSTPLRIAPYARRWFQH